MKRIILALAIAGASFAAFALPPPGGKADGFQRPKLWLADRALTGWAR